MGLTYGVIPLARPTFDVPFAEASLGAALGALKDAGIEVVGPDDLLFDADAAEAAFAALDQSAIDALVILQVTFTDASMTVRLAERARTPVSIWALPEPRLGGRLRLNAFCGLNLAAHALGKADIAHSWLYAAPDAPNIGDDLARLGRVSPPGPSAASPVAGGGQAPEAQAALKRLHGADITLIGDHPDGFHTCAYDSDTLEALNAIKVTRFSVHDLFERAKAIDDTRVASVHAGVARNLNGLDLMDPEQLDRSLRVFCALEDLQAETGARGLAVRCWPETFTDYGCAACGPMAMMTQNRVPAACEADVYGSITTVLLQELSGEPAWMADLVDLDFADDTGVLWHCGLAPLSMCDAEAEPEATIHTNRKMPLLHQFPLKPGVITIARLSQARNEPKLVIGAAEVLPRPMAFTGTSGVVRFAKPASCVFDTVLREGLEHHYSLAYGDHRGALRAVAAGLDLPVLELA